MRDTPLSLDEMRERLDRSQEEALVLIAESRGLRVTLRELVDRSRREREERLRCMVLPQAGQTGFAGGRETGSRLRHPIRNSSTSTIVLFGATAARKPIT
jgi:hypothetical protein